MEHSSTTLLPPLLIRYVFTRALRTFQTNEAMVAKLFAKHIKLKDAIEFVKKTRMNFGVGTPSRLIDLFSAGNSPRYLVPCPYLVFIALYKLHKLTTQSPQAPYPSTSWKE